MAKGTGEIKKFLSPEDEAALRVASHDYEQARKTDDKEQRDASVSAGSELKERIRENVQREIYSRAKEFGDVLVSTYEREHLLPWREIRKALDGEAVAVKNKHKFDDIFERIEGLSVEQSRFFQILLDIAEQDFRRTGTVLNAVSGLKFSEKVRQQSGGDKKEIFFSPEEAGKSLFIAANKKGHSPKGKARCVNKGMYLELYLDNEEDVAQLYEPGDIVTDVKETEYNKRIIKSIGGFFSSDRQVRLPVSMGVKLLLPSVPIDGYLNLPMIVIHATPWNMQSDELVSHEENHYFNNLIRNAHAQYRGDKGSQGAVSGLTEIEEKMGQTDSDTPEKDIIILREQYRKKLDTLRNNFFSRAKDEIIADYRATGNFEHLYNLLEKEEDAERRGEAALYDFFYRQFGKVWREIPDILKDMILETQKQYHRELKEQVESAEEVSEMIGKFKTLKKVNENSYRAMPDNKYANALYSLMQETPILSWKERLSAAYRRDLKAYRGYQQLCQRFYNAKDFFIKHENLSDWNLRQSIDCLSGNFEYDISELETRSADLDDFPNAYKEKRPEIDTSISEFEELINGFKKDKGLM